MSQQDGYWAAPPQPPQPPPPQPPMPGWQPPVGGYGTPPPGAPPGWAPPGSWLPQSTAPAYRKSSNVPAYIAGGLVALVGLGGIAFWMSMTLFGVKQAAKVPGKLAGLQAQVALRNVAMTEEVVRAQTDSFTTDLELLRSRGLTVEPNVTIRIHYADARRFCASAKVPRDDSTWYWDSRKFAAEADRPCF